MERDVLVHVDLDGTPVLAGSLWMRTRRGRESASFEYDRAWLNHPRRFSLDPALTVGPGSGSHTVTGGLFWPSRDTGAFLRW